MAECLEKAGESLKGKMGWIKMIYKSFDGVLNPKKLGSVCKSRERAEMLMTQPLTREMRKES